MMFSKSTGQSHYDPQSLLNSQPVIVTVIDPSTHHVQFQNQTGLGKFGDIGGQPCHAAIGGSAAPCQFCRMGETLRTGELTSNEVPLPNGQTILVHWAKTVTESGEAHVIETITDITDRKRIEEQLRQAQKMEAVGRMASGIAHDFNNLLMVINGFTARLVAKHGSDPRLSHLQVIGDAGARAASLTKKLLSFSRQQPLQLSVVNLNQVLDGLHTLMTKSLGEHIQLMLALDPELGTMSIDPVQLEQVVLNLVINARDAMPQGGELVIQTSNTEMDESFVARHPGSRPGRYVSLSIKDSGCGMDDDTQAHIFDPFFTTKSMGDGTGLGLTTVYGIIKQHHGYITVSSALGHGAKFQLYFPRVTEQTPNRQEISNGTSV
jgi:two-component system, cell cycle sensor histidine kinase and response regulator CckA